MCNFLSAFRIGVSPSYFNKKSAELGKLHNVVMLQQKDEDEAVLKSIISAKQCIVNDPSVPGETITTSIQSYCSDISTQVENNNCLATITPTCEPNTSSSVSTCRHPEHCPPYSCSSSELVNKTTTRNELENLSVVPSNVPFGSSPSSTTNNTVLKTATQNIGLGWKIAFDNLDIFQRVRHMREDNQNKDHHWINHTKVTNRISGNHLQDDKPICKSVMELDNVKIIPTYPQHISQRGDYILIKERILTEEIPCLTFCRNVVTMHIPHCHSSEMSNKSEKVCQYTFSLLKSYVME